MAENSDKGLVRPSFFRRLWLRIMAVAEDHPFASLSLFGALLAIVLFYGFRLGGFDHFRESWARWRVENFGGRHHVDRSVRTSDVVLSFHRMQFDQLDAFTMTAAHLKASAFRKELKEMAAEEGGRIRIVALDPRLGDVDHPLHPAFAELAAAFGHKPWEYSARCWHSVAVLIELENEIGESLQVRLLTEALPDATPPFFSIGRSGHAYRAKDPDKRLDIIVPRPSKPSGTDSFTHPADIFVNRSGNAEVQRFHASFETAWERSIPLDEPLKNEFLIHLRGEDTPGS